MLADAAQLIQLCIVAIGDDAAFPQEVRRRIDDGPRQQGVLGGMIAERLEVRRATSGEGVERLRPAEGLVERGQRAEGGAQLQQDPAAAPSAARYARTMRSRSPTASQEPAAQRREAGDASKQVATA